MRRARALASALVVAIGGCDGSSFDSGLDAAGDLQARDFAVRAGFPPPAPPMISAGGPVLASMQLYTVVWAGDEAAGAALDAFHAAVFASSYWADTVGEFGAGPGTARGVVVMPGPRPTALSDGVIGYLVHQLMQDGRLPADDSQTVVDFLLGADLQTYNMMPVATFCNFALAYHNELTTAPHTPFLVEPPCAPPPGVTAADNLTWADTHEMAETATDPHPFTATAFIEPVTGLEVCDMCNDVPVRVALAVPDGGAQDFLVTKVYSGRHAQLGDADPCRPAPDGPYTNIAFAPSDITIQTDVTGHGSTQVNLVAFGRPGPMNWRIFGPVSAFPKSGIATPGDVIPVTLTATHGLGQPSPLFLLILDPAHPGESPLQEYIASLTIQ